MKKRLIVIISVIIIIVIILLINLSIVNNIEFNLIGNNEISLNVNDKWIDPGYTINNYKDKVKVINNVDLSKEGLYKVKYIIRIGLFAKTLEREIEVLPEYRVSDTTLILNGDSPYYLSRGGSFNDPGIKVFDKYQGNLDNKVIVVNNNINNQVNGKYEVVYEVVGSNGVIKRLKRDIIVYLFEFDSKTKYTEYSQDNEIILSISDSRYRYTILPNNSQTSEKEIIYPVNENGLYHFTFYDKNNENIFVYDINITNIDKEPPSGTCTLSLNDSSGIITVNAKDNKEIGGYQYIYGENKTNLLLNSQYTINTLDDTASIIVYDKANNKANIKCETVDNSTKIANGYTLKTYQFNGKTYKYWFYAPKNNTVRSKMPLVIYMHGDGGRKSPNDINKYGLPKYVANGVDYPFFMVAPYCDNYANFSNESYLNLTIDLIEYVTKNYNIDTSRIIMSGGSSGAAGAYLSAARDKIFSCLVIISGVTHTLDTDKEQNLTYLPIWIFHAKDDQNVDYNVVKSHVNNIKLYGGDIQLTTYSGGHSSTDPAFETQALIEWMVSQRRKT